MSTNPRRFQDASLDFIDCIRHLRTLEKNQLAERDARRALILNAAHLLDEVGCDLSYPDGSFYSFLEALIDELDVEPTEK